MARAGDRLVPAYGTGLFDARSSALCLLFFSVIAFGMWATHAFDDITGYRDGSDVRNYAPERRRSQVKPLVAGLLSVRQAQAFAYVTALLAATCVVVFCVVAGFQPWWIFVGGLAVVGLACSTPPGSTSATASPAEERP